jgi:hypothetical protein
MPSPCYSRRPERPAEDAGNATDLEQGTGRNLGSARRDPPQRLALVGAALTRRRAGPGLIVLAGAMIGLVDWAFTRHGGERPVQADDRTVGVTTRF